MSDNSFERNMGYQQIEQQLEAIWLGPDSALLDGLWERVTVYHVQNVRGVERALQHGLAACLILDADLSDPAIEGLLAHIRGEWPYVGVLAFIDPPLTALLTETLETGPFAALDRVVSRTVTSQHLVEIIEELTSQAEWDLASSDYPTLRDRARQLEGLVQGTLAMGMPSDDILDNLREVARVAVDADDVAILMTDEANTDLSDMLDLGVPVPYITVCREHFRELSGEARMMYLGDEVLLRERTPDMAPNTVRVREAESVDAWSYMRFPIIVDQRLIGFVGLFSDTPGQFNGAHLQLGRLFAAQVGTAVRNRQFFLRLNRAEQYQRSVSDVARLLAENLELDEVLKYIVEEAVDLVDGHTGSVSLVQPDRSLVVGATHNLPPTWLNRRVEAGVGQMGMIALTGRPSVVEDYANWDQANPAMRETFPEETILFGVPLSYRNLVLGVLQVMRRKDIPGDPNEALEALMLLTPSAATAIAKAQLHETIQQERRQLQAILDHTPAAVVMCDARGKVQLVNPAAREIAERLGIDARYVVDRRVGDLMAQLLPDDAELLTEIPRAVEFILGPFGEYVVRIAAITRPDGEVDGYVAVAQDVTEMRKVDRMKSNLNRVLTHDLGNLIMLAQNPLALLDEPDLLPGQRDQLKEMLSGSLERMRALIQDVMELDMVPSLDDDTVAPYQLKVLARQAVERNQDAALKKDIRLTLDEVDILPPLQGHTVLIMQAIDNLVSNAVKYTPDGGHVTVTTLVEGDYAVVQVTDDGYGIPADQLDLIWEPFVRIRDDRTRHIQGTGLGLNLVKTFVEVHGGRVAVESEMDRGSTFTLYLPFERTEAKAPTRSAIVRIDLSARVVAQAGTDPLA